MIEEPGWYTENIRAAMDQPAVQDQILKILVEISENGGDPELDELEWYVFGDRVEHESCGSMNLPYSPHCWGCEEKLSWPAPPGKKVQGRSEN